jgi:hypothetical protein
MNKKDRGILYGMSLGDGCIHKQSTNKNYAITIGHGPNQKEYLEYKADKLHSIFGGKTININTYTSFNKTTQKSYTNLQFRKLHPYFNQIHRNLYPTGKKVYTRKVLDYLTDEGLAIWFMDDGSGIVVKNKKGYLCGCMVRISTYCTKEEATTISKWFDDVYGFKCKFDRDNRNNRFSIRFGTLDSIEFCKLVSPFVPSFMKYKTEQILNYTPRVLGTLTEGEDIV